MRPSLLGATVAIALCGVARIGAQRDDAPSSQIEWSADRRLTISDFKGKIPGRAVQNSMSAVSIELSWECADGKGSSVAKAVFDPNSSWWRDPSPNLWRNADAPSLSGGRDDRGTTLLAHEQLHFDLTELWARKARDLFKDLPSTCKTPGASPSFERSVAVLEREWSAEQEQYDRETANGTNRSRQQAWAAKVEKALRQSYSLGGDNVPAAR